MKRLIVQEFISVDGFCADRQKTTVFFDGTYNMVGDELIPYQEKLIESIDFILLGKETYKMFTNYWPDAGGENSKVASAMNRIPKIVFSSSLKEVHWGNYGNISLVAEDAVNFVKSFKLNEEKNIIIWGSISLVKSLLSAGLIDEIQLVIVPVSIGKGDSLFPEDFNLFHLELADHKVLSNGVVLLEYNPLKK